MAGRWVGQPPICDLKGAPTSSVIFLEIRLWKNHYSAVKSYFRFNKLPRNYLFIRYMAM